MKIKTSDRAKGAGGGEKKRVYSVWGEGSLYFIRPVIARYNSIKHANEVIIGCGIFAHRNKNSHLLNNLFPAINSHLLIINSHKPPPRPGSNKRRIVVL